MEQGLLTDLYYDEILKVINEIRATERENILKAARMIADQVKQDKLVYVFGPGGHSNLAAMEVFFRAGGLMHISAILNQETMLSSGALKSMQTERLPGYGKIVVEDYGIGEGDLLWIVNAYGINSATIDAALTAKAHGAKVIGVSSHEHAETCPLDHSRPVIPAKRICTMLWTAASTARSSWATLRWKFRALSRRSALCPPMRMPT